MKSSALAKLLTLVCGAALLAGAIALTKTSPVWAQATTVRIGYNKIWPTFPLHVAIARRMFEQRGLAVKWSNFQTPNEILLAMVAGELDLGVVTGPNLVTAHEQGVKVKGLALLTGPGEPPNTLFARKDLNVRSVVDLKGKTIGVNNYGGNFDLYVRRYLADKGLDPKIDVRIIEIPVFQIISAITTRIIDAGMVDTIFTAVALKNYSSELTPVFSYRDVGPFKDGWNGLILAANESFVISNRAAVVQLLRVYLDALQFAEKNAQEAVKLYVDATGNKNALLLDKGNDVPADGQVMMPEMQSDIELMAQFGYIKTVFKADAVLDRKLLDEAAQAR
jgi:ABC-type nitrate/sulfonate/bicarbonate transport system substrate-binding protein